MLKWEKVVHKVYKRWPLGKGMQCPLGKWQWISERFSIIQPSIATFKAYELYDGEDIYRFDTLKECKQKAEELNQ